MMEKVKISVDERSPTTKTKFETFLIILRCEISASCIYIYTTLNMIRDDESYKSGLTWDSPKFIGSLDLIGI